MFIPVIFPVHPRTKAKIKQAGFRAPKNLHLISPLGYLEFLGLEERAKFVLTDSGGVQEETTWLGVPCFTVRPNTERPITITQGTNQLVSADTDAILSCVQKVLTLCPRSCRKPPDLWDGHAGSRIAEVLSRTLK
jgi:UDP-N-acetylglucosamine 2-epimerase (non-hydrolysing)